MGRRAPRDPAAAQRQDLRADLRCTSGLVGIEGMGRAPAAVAERHVHRHPRLRSGLYASRSPSDVWPGATVVSPPRHRRRLYARRAARATVHRVCTSAGSGRRGSATQRRLPGRLYCGASRDAPFKRVLAPIQLTVTDRGRSRALRGPRRASPDFYRLLPQRLRVSTTSPRSTQRLPAPRLGASASTSSNSLETLARISTASRRPGYFRFSRPFDFNFLRNTNGVVSRSDTNDGPLARPTSHRRTRYSAHVLTVFTRMAARRCSPATPPVGGSACRCARDRRARRRTAICHPVAATARETRRTPSLRDYDKLRAGSAQQIPRQRRERRGVTLADPAATMRRVAAAVAAGPAPVLSNLFECGVTTGTDACDDGTEARRCGATNDDFTEIHGKIKLPIFQTGTAPYLRPADGGAINIVGGNAVKVRDEEVCFALTLPKGAAPTAGWPLVIYGHGTGGSFRSFIRDGVAASLAKAGTKMAVLGFDEVQHGARRGASTRGPDELVFNVPTRARRATTSCRAPPICCRGPRARAPSPARGRARCSSSREGVPTSDTRRRDARLPSRCRSATTPARRCSPAPAPTWSRAQTKTSPSETARALAFLLVDGLSGFHPMMSMWQAVLRPRRSPELQRQALPRAEDVTPARRAHEPGARATPSRPKPRWNCNAVTLAGELPTTTRSSRIPRTPRGRSRPSTRTFATPRGVHPVEPSATTPLRRLAQRRRRRRRRQLPGLVLRHRHSRDPLGVVLRSFVVAAPGLEEVVAGEARALGAADAGAVIGGVELTADPALLLRLNLGLRAASRILVRVASGGCATWRRCALRRRQRWEPFAAVAPPAVPQAPPLAPLRPRERSPSGPRQRRPMARRAPTRRPGGTCASGRRGPLSVDSSGELRHRRGYRTDTRARCGETLAGRSSTGR